MIRELGKYITDNIASLVLGENFFVGHAPINAQNDFSALIESGGNFNFYLPDKGEARYQILSKGVNYFDARTEAWEIFRFLHGKRGITLPVIVSDEIYLANTIEGIQSPQYLGVDERGRHMVSTNYVVKVQEP